MLTETESPVTVKDEYQSDVEYEDALQDLYRDHQIKEELVVGPEVILKRPEAVGDPSQPSASSLLPKLMVCIPRLDLNQDFTHKEPFANTQLPNPVVRIARLPLDQDSHRHKDTDSDESSDSELLIKIKQKKVSNISDSDSDPLIRIKQKKQRNGSDSDSEPLIKIKQKKLRNGSDSDSEPLIKIKQKKQRNGSDSDSEPLIKIKRKKLRNGSDSESDPLIRIKQKKLRSRSNSHYEPLNRIQQNKLRNESDSDFESLIIGIKQKKLENGKQIKQSSKRRYYCPYCKELCYKKRNLIEHERTHKNVKKYQCQICDRKFKVSDYLSKHIKRHGPLGKRRIGRKATKARWSGR